jgi:hypothetical protein
MLVLSYSDRFLRRAVMRLRLTSLRGLLALARVTAVLVLLSCAPSLSDVATTAIPVVMTTLLVAVLALVLVTAHVRQPLVRTATASGRARYDALTPARQCDPDAAGHVRPRAPGMSLTVSTH